MHLVDGNALQLLPQLPAADVIYLDPMFPERQKSALVRKAMRFFHDIVGDDDDGAALLPVARLHAKHRVVVKRPLHAPFLADATPTYQLKGKAMRYDIYVNSGFHDA
jgi:16S rRNA (guanine1516-N2)-methyltransferase